MTHHSYDSSSITLKLDAILGMTLKLGTMPSMTLKLAHFRKSPFFQLEFHKLPVGLWGTSAHKNDRADLLYMFTYLTESKNVIKKFSIFSTPNSTWTWTLPGPDPRPKITFLTYPSLLQTIWVKKNFRENFPFFGSEDPFRSQASTGPPEGPSRKPTSPSDPP